MYIKKIVIFYLLKISVECNCPWWVSQRMELTAVHSGSWWHQNSSQNSELPLNDCSHLTIPINVTRLKLLKHCNLQLCRPNLKKEVAALLHSIGRVETAIAGIMFTYRQCAIQMLSSWCEGFIASHHFYTLCLTLLPLDPLETVNRPSGSQSNADQRAG